MPQKKKKKKKKKKNWKVNSKFQGEGGSLNIDKEGQQIPQCRLEPVHSYRSELR